MCAIFDFISGRGRDRSCLRLPAQIRASGITALGSYLEFWHQTVPEAKDDRYAPSEANWYALRWKIEVFHKILKSGCKAEESKLRSSERLANLIAIFCIIGWRVFWLTMLPRAEPDLPPSIALDATEVQLLDALVKTPPGKSQAEPTVADYIIKTARLGSYLNRVSDPPTGNLVM